MRAELNGELERYNKAQKKRNKKDTGNFTRAFEPSFDKLPQESWFTGNMSLDAAKFTIDAYHARNLNCHSDLKKFKEQRQWKELAAKIEEDLNDLPKILPQNRLSERNNWERTLMCYYRDTTIRRESGVWVQVRDEEINLKGKAPHKPIDARDSNLPYPVQEAAFLHGDYWPSENPSSKECRRRGDHHSDPTQGKKRPICLVSPVPEPSERHRRVVLPVPESGLPRRRQLAKEMHE